MPTEITVAVSDRNNNEWMVRADQDSDSSIAFRAALEVAGNAVATTNAIPINGGSAAFTLTKVTLSTNASTSLVAANLGRKYLAIQNTGTGLVEMAPGASAAIGNGWQLAPATTGGYGGTMVWENNAITTDAWAGISAAGSTVIVLQG